MLNVTRQTHLEHVKENIEFNNGLSSNKMINHGNIKMRQKHETTD